MHVAAIEGARYGVLANCIAPGARTRMTEGMLGPLDELLDPAQVSSMAVFLASPQCEQTHEIYSAGGGRFARYVVGVNDGWFAPQRPAEPADVLANLATIRDLTDLHVLDNGPEEFALLESLARKAGAL